MMFAPTCSRHERMVMRRLRVLGLERAIRPRHEFRVDLRDRLVAEAAAGHDDRVAC